MLPRCLGIHLRHSEVLQDLTFVVSLMPRPNGPICWGRNPWEVPNNLGSHRPSTTRIFKKMVTQATQLTARSPAIPAVGICMAAMLAARTSKLLGILGKWCCLFKDRGLVWISIDFPIILRVLGCHAKVVQLPGLKILPEYLGRS